MIKKPETKDIVQSLAGWLETRLAQITSNYLKLSQVV